MKAFVGFAMLGIVAIAISFPAGAEVLRGEAQCGALTSAASGVDWGPFDYRSAPEANKERVEKYHFPPSVELLKRGASSAYVGADIDFVLRYFPNHLRALNAMTNLAKREKTDQPRGSRYRLDCWYDRAVRIAPTDAQVRVLYGIWLGKRGERILAREQLDQVAELDSESAMLAYNLGLAYLEIGDSEKALSAAHKAYNAGFKLPGLKNRLQRAGKWRDQPVQDNLAVDSKPESGNVISESK